MPKETHLYIRQQMAQTCCSLSTNKKSIKTNQLEMVSDSLGRLKLV